MGRYVGPKNSNLTFKEFLLNHLKDNYKFIINLIIKAIIIAVCSVLGSFYFQSLIDQIEQMSYAVILMFSGVFIIISFTRIIVNYQRKKLEIRIRQYLNHEYVNKTVMNMLYLPFSYFQNNQDGVNLTKIQNLFMLSEFFIHLYITLFIDVIMFVGLISALMFFSLILAGVLIIFFAVIALVVITQLKLINEQNKQIINSQETMNQGYIEYLKNFYNSHQFFTKRFIKEKINYLFEEYNFHLLKRDDGINDLNGISETLVQLLSFTIVIIACFFYKQGLISVGDIIFFYMLVSYMIEPLFNIINFVIEKDEVLVLFERYKEITPTKDKKKIKLKGRIKEIKFDHISYSYGYSKPIIEHLDLLINKSLWIKGDTGAGKSTLLKLLMKYDDLLKGNIFINGVDLAKIDLNSLYHKIIYLNQEPIFYHETLRFNLLLNQTKESEMIELLELFELTGLIKQLDLLLEIDGTPLSSGQKQLIMIIRAILKKPDVLILDEAMSNVDEFRVQKIIEVLHSRLPKTMIILVSHQTKIVNELFDCVIMKEGKIINK